MIVVIKNIWENLQKIKNQEMLVYNFRKIGEQNI